jgi:hypothetical protein
MGKAKLDRAYSGGTAAFRIAITEKLDYPRSARVNGTVGTSIFSFKVNCENMMPYDFQFETIMSDGIEEAIVKAIQNTQPGWVHCTSGEERIRLMLSFTINNEGFFVKNALAVINAMDPGNNALDDGLLIKRATKAFEKNKTAKAEKLVQQLIARYPNNENYRDLLDKIKSN